MWIIVVATSACPIRFRACAYDRSHLQRVGGKCCSKACGVGALMLAGHCALLTSLAGQPPEERLNL